MSSKSHVFWDSLWLFIHLSIPSLQENAAAEFLKILEKEAATTLDATVKYYVAQVSKYLIPRVRFNFSMRGGSDGLTRSGIYLYSFYVRCAQVGWI